MDSLSSKRVLGKPIVLSSEQIIIHEYIIHQYNILVLIKATNSSYYLGVHV